MQHGQRVKKTSYRYAQNARMIWNCWRLCNRIFKTNILVTIVVCGMIFYISTWVQLVQEAPARGKASVILQKKQMLVSSSRRNDGTNTPAITLLGRPRPYKGFLTIGIPTVCRAHDRYLHTTLSSIINSTAHDDQKRIHIVVAVSFLNQTCALEVKNTINEMFDTYVKSGLVELIGVPVEAYPPLHNLRKTYDDDESRVRWRSKQNIDYSFLMAHNANRSTYYMQLEDDVTTNSGYLKAIEQFINDTTEYWAMLEFSSLGFIGKLFRSSDLHKIANLLRTFYAEQPCDFLMIHFMKLMMQNKRMLKIPTLFQHHGIQSSLPNLTRNLSDRFYAVVTKTIKGDNPSADIYTSLKQYKLHKPVNAYNNNVTGFFWALPPNVGDTLTIVFKRPQCLKRFALSSGFQEKGDDKIASGVVEVGNLIKSLTGDTVNCTGLRFIGDIQDGQIDQRNITLKSGCEHPENKIVCIKLTFTTKHTQWVVISEIAVFIHSIDH